MLSAIDYPLQRIITVCVMLWLVISINGCDTLPPGTPPSGPIITNEPVSADKMTINRAIDYMTTSLIATAVSNNLRNKLITLAFIDRYSKQVFRHAATVTGMLAVRAQQQPDFILFSKFVKQPKAMHWEMRLIRWSDRKIIWQESLQIVDKFTPAS